MNWRTGVVIVSLTALLAACDNMANQASMKPYEVPYGSQIQWPITPPEHTVARDQPLKPPAAPPVTMALLQRGQQRFDIYCSPCHGLAGDGNGIIVQRGFPHPPSYYSDRLKAASNEHFYDVITEGYGAMYSYADRVEPSDRWAITAYVRALQASAAAQASDVPPDKLDALK